MAEPLNHACMNHKTYQAGVLSETSACPGLSTLAQVFNAKIEFIPLCSLLEFRFGLNVACLGYHFGR